MANTALILAKNLSHNVSVRIEEAKTSLCHLANVSLVTEVAGQFAATVEAKQRDLQRFLTFYQKLYKHDRQTWPRHPCQQWGLKTTGCARVPDRVLTSRTRLGMLCCITYCSDCSFQRKTSCRVKSRRVRVSSVSASLMS